MKELDDFDVKHCTNASYWAGLFEPTAEEFDPFKEVQEHLIKMWKTTLCLCFNLQKCEANGYDVIYEGHFHHDGVDIKNTESKDVGINSKEEDKKWLKRTFADVWIPKTKLILRNLRIFSKLAEYIYPAKVLQEGNGLILPLSKCPSDLFDEMKWYVS